MSGAVEGYVTGRYGPWGDEDDRLRIILRQGVDGEDRYVIVPAEIYEDLLAALKECADDLEAWVRERHGYGDDIHPAMQRRYERDMEPVRTARAAIAKAEGGAE